MGDQLCEILEYLAYSFLSGSLLPFKVESVIIDLAQVLSLPFGIVTAQFQPHGHEPFAELLAVAEKMEVRVVGVPPWIGNRAAVLIPFPVNKLHFLMLLSVLSWHPLVYQLSQEGVIMVGAFEFSDADYTAILDEPLELLGFPDLRPDAPISLQFVLQLLFWHVPHGQCQEPQPLLRCTLLQSWHVRIHQDTRADTVAVRTLPALARLQG